VLALAFFAGVSRSGAAVGTVRVYLVIPFGEPGDTDPQFVNATGNLTAALSELDIRTALSTPVDQIEVVGQAGTLCERFHASGILIPQLKFEQSKERNLTGFLPVVGGVVSSSGVFDAFPIRARVKLYLIGCDGHVVWKTIANANKVHHGQNVAAGLTQIAREAIRTAAGQFAARR